MRVDSMFYSAKLSVYEITLIIFLFAQKEPSKVIIRLLSIDEKEATNWTRHQRNACTRMLHLNKILLVGKGSGVHIDETHWFKVHKHDRRNCRKHRTWLFAVVSRNSS